MEKVRWREVAQPVAAPCPLCGHSSGNVALLDALHWRVEDGVLELARCAACGSAYYTDVDAHVEYPNDPSQIGNPDFRILLYHYFELVSGLEWKVSLLERMPFERFESVLELGCNMGVALDYCRVAWGVDAIGLEPSVYGRGGSELLGVPVRSALLGDAPEADREFDMIFATEVLEHVADPRALLSELAERLRPDGMLLVTTPAAENVTKAAAPGDLYATLSAGAHRFVPSRRALGDLLRGAGFVFQEAAVTGNSQVLYGSRRPFTLATRDDADARRLAYYVKKASDTAIDDRIRLASLIHAYDIAASLGLAEQPGIEADIEELLRGHFQLELTGDLEHRLAEVRNIFDYGARLPFGLPLFLRARALRRRDHREALELHALGALSCIHGLRADFQNLFPYHSMWNEHTRALVRGARRGRLSRNALRLAAKAISVEATVPELSTRTSRLTAAGLRALRLV